MSANRPSDPPLTHPTLWLVTLMEMITTPDRQPRNVNSSRNYQDDENQVHLRYQIQKELTREYHGNGRSDKVARVSSPETDSSNQFNCCVKAATVSLSDMQVAAWAAIIIISKPPTQN